MYSGKALYNPQGRSAEYARWAVNYYNGCTGGCEYCYNRRFPLLSQDTPTLKVQFRDEVDAYGTAKREIEAHRDVIVRDGGLLLSFVSDPMLPKTIELTMRTVKFCAEIGVPVMILTKRGDFLWSLNVEYCHAFGRYSRLLKRTPAARNIAFGFTLTGHDELEPGCDSNESRITAMELLKEDGYRTWASIEPIIDFESSLRMIEKSAPVCDHFKIGIRTDRRFDCTVDEVVDFVNAVRGIVGKSGSTVYFKQSLRDLIGGGFIIGSRFVDAGYNIFHD